MPSIKPCQLLFGPDQGKQQAYIAFVRKNLEQQLGMVPEQVNYHAGQDDCDSIVAVLRNGSLFSEHLLVIVSRAEAFSAAEAKKLAAYWQKPNPHCTVLFLSETYKDAKDRFSFAPKDDLQVFWEVDENEKPEWIKSYIRKNDGIIDQDALELLCELVDSDSLALKRDCDTLLCIRPDRRISVEEVEAYIFHSREESVFTLFDTILNLDFESSLSAMQKILLSQGSDPIGIIAGLQWQFRSFSSLKSMAGRGPATRDVFDRLKIRNIKTQQTLNHALRRWDNVDIEHRLQALARFDVELRQNKQGMHGVLMECLMYQLTASPHFLRVLGPGSFGIFEGV